MKKLTSLFMSGILSITLFTGCRDNESTVEYKEENKQEQQVEEREEVDEQEEVQVEEPKQEQKVEDEDLNPQYEYRIQVNNLDKAVEILEPIFTENFGADGYIILKYEEYNSIVIVLNLPIYELQTFTIDEWNELVDLMVELQLISSEYVMSNGLNVGVGLMVADLDADEFFLGIVNGEVVYDVVNGIDKLN